MVHCAQEMMSSLELTTGDTSTRKSLYSSSVLQVTVALAVVVDLV